MESIKKSLIKVYSVPKNTRSTVIVGLLFLCLISIIQNFDQIKSILALSLSLPKKLSLIMSIILNLYTGNLVALELVLHLVLATLFAVNLTLSLHYFKKRGSGGDTISGSGTALFASILGLIGSGCAACGSVVLTLLLGSASAFAILAKLPFGGQEFLYLAIVVLVYSIYSVSKKIQAPLVC